MDPSLIIWSRTIDLSYHVPKMVDLSSNQLSGTIPEEITNVAQLGIWNHSINSLMGAIPQKMSSLGEKLIVDYSETTLLQWLPMLEIQVSVAFSWRFCPKSDTSEEEFTLSWWKSELLKLKLKSKHSFLAKPHKEISIPTIYLFLGL
ncbi:hypothetical protein Pfo_002315, partial [Paulownia fortunei]